MSNLQMSNSQPLVTDPPKAPDTAKPASPDQTNKPADVKPNEQKK